MNGPKERLLVNIMLLVFRINGRLLEQGNRLVERLNLTSARWQVLGALAKADRPLTAPQIAEAMGITRQGAQKQLNLLMDEELIERHSNPIHERSPLYKLTGTGVHVFAQADQLCDLWAADLGHAFSKSMLLTTEDTLSELLTCLDRELPSNKPSNEPPNTHLRCRRPS